MRNLLKTIYEWWNRPQIEPISEKSLKDMFHSWELVDNGYGLRVPNPTPNSVDIIPFLIGTFPNLSYLYQNNTLVIHTMCREIVATKHDEVFMSYFTDLLEDVSTYTRRHFISNNRPNLSLASIDKHNNLLERQLRFIETCIKLIKEGKM